MRRPPRSAHWYVAEIVERITVAGDRRSVTHVNFCLVQAGDADEAYTKARALGRAGELSYRNPKGRRVSIKFIGLRELHVVHDPLEHGAELLFEEHVGMSGAASRALIRPRSRLSAFRPIRPSPGPDYAAGDIVREAELRASRWARGARGA